MEFKFTFAETILQLCPHETSYFFVGKLMRIPVLVRLTIDTTSHLVGFYGKPFLAEKYELNSEPG